MLQSLELKNVGKFDTAKFEFKRINLISGKNGEGKSTLKKTLESVFENLYDERLISNGADEATIISRLSNGTTIKRVLKRGGRATIDIRDANGAKIGKEETYLKSLASGFGFDPVRLMRADKKEREKFLLKVLPINFEKPEIDEAVGFTTAISGHIDLAYFDQYLSGREQERTSANTLRDNLEGTLATLKSSMPPKSDTDWSAEVRRIHAALDAKRGELTSSLSQIDKDQAEAYLSLAHVKNAKIADIRRRMQLEIDAAEAEYLSASGALAQGADQEKDRKRQEAQPEIDQLVMEHAHATSKSEELQRAEGTRESVRKVEGQIRDAARNATELQRQVNELRKLRTKKLADESIPGVEIKGGDIFVDGKDYDLQLNEAERIKVAFSICARAIGPEAILICDVEGLDGDNKIAVQEWCRENGYQLFMTEVRTATKEDPAELKLMAS